jgi:hypothetical protein
VAGCQRSTELLVLALVPPLGPALVPPIVPGGGANVGPPAGVEALGLESSPRRDPSIGQKAAWSS